MDGFKALVPYIGAAISIGGGFAMLYVPPTGMEGQAGTVAFATALIVGGLAALGVTVAVPAVRADARRSAMMESALTPRRRSPRASPATPTPTPSGQFSYSETTTTERKG